MYICIAVVELFEGLRSSVEKSDGGGSVVGGVVGSSRQLGAVDMSRMTAQGLLRS